MSQAEALRLIEQHLPEIVVGAVIVIGVLRAIVRGRGNWTGVSFRGGCGG